MSLYSAIKHCEDCKDNSYYEGRGEITKLIRLQARTEADKALDNYLASSTSPSETATRARVQGLQRECAECDYSNPLIAGGLKVLFDDKHPDSETEGSLEIAIC